MMNTVAPVWDGNETWLVLGGGGLLAAFPLAYAVLMPALYLPVLMMLAGLILRGVAFEFRFRARDRGQGASGPQMFAGGSILAAFAQGLILGGFIQGVQVADDRFAGGPFDWLTPYTLLVACGLVAGYALLGATWLIWQDRRTTCTATRAAGPGSAPCATAALLAAVSVATLVAHPRDRRALGLAGRPDGRDRLGGVRAARARSRCSGVAGLAMIFAGLRARGRTRWPFVGALTGVPVGLSGAGGQLLPLHRALRHGLPAGAPAPDNALGLMLVGHGLHPAGHPGLHRLGLLGVPRQGDPGDRLSLDPSPRPAPTIRCRRCGSG